MQQQHQQQQQNNNTCSHKNALAQQKEADKELQDAAALAAPRMFLTFEKRTVEKYILYWTLDVCEGEAKHRKTPSRLTLEATTHKREFDLFGLESSCVYELTIHTVNFSGDRGEGQKQFFRTPPCWKTNGRTSSVDLPIQSLQPTCACQAVVSWQHQQQSQHAQHSGGLASDHARTAAEPSGYSVRWGPESGPVAKTLPVWPWSLMPSRTASTFQR
ncbi:hypothetical protein EGW08_021791 [Elysia chlorotica]|uniref:Uncharacterized protein n=1 Tax=Elysia chlorotica TaxID=188477 RepID=A0A433SMP0_ELYCH|nr:hypothetical protein EGW08_021791 [Elysia chlorotica]